MTRALAIREREGVSLPLQPSPVVEIGGVRIGNHIPLVLIAGPCQLESRQHAFDMAGALDEMTRALGIGFVYKTSFDKANRTSGQSPRGMGCACAQGVFAELRNTLRIPILTDVHEPEQVWRIGKVVDCLQIPALLSRQTDLITEAGRTGLPINIKKGQFMAPWDMKHAVDKVLATGNCQVMVTERGTCFGYNALVNDFRSLKIMADTTLCPVVFDATHSAQVPGGLGNASGGNHSEVPLLARASVAAGVAAVFIETHQDPENAPSDGPCMVPLKDMADLIDQLLALDRVVKRNAA